MDPTDTLIDHVKVGIGFRAVIPPAARKRFGLTEGSDLIAEIDEHGVHFYTLEHAARRSAAILARYIDPKRILSEELIADRREEARREAGE